MALEFRSDSVQELRSSEVASEHSSFSRLPRFLCLLAFVAMEDSFVANTLSCVVIGAGTFARCWSPSEML